MVYLIEFDNGESYSEDYSSWIDSKVYTNYGDSVEDLMSKGYVLDDLTGIYTLLDDRIPSFRAWIIRLKVINNKGVTK